LPATELVILVNPLFFFKQPQYRLGLFALLSLFIVLVFSSRLLPGVQSLPATDLQFLLLDDPAVMTADQALQQPAARWQRWPDKTPLSYPGKHGFWLRLDSPAVAGGALQLSTPWLDEVELYQFDHNGVLLQQLQTGDQYRFASRPLATADWVFPLLENCAAVSCPLLIHIRHAGQVQLSIHLHPLPQLLTMQQQQQLILAVQLGVMLFVMLLSVLLALLTARADYAWLTTQLLAVLLILLDRTGAGFQWLWPEMPRVNLWIGLATPLLMLSSCALLMRYFQPSQQTWVRKALLTLQALAVLWGLQLVWLIWIPSPSWQAVLHDNAGFLLLLMLLFGCISTFKSYRLQRSRTMLLLPSLLLQTSLVSLCWPVNLPMAPLMAPWAAVLLATVAAMVLVSARLSQLYLKKLSLSRIQQQLLLRNQQLAAFQQQELLRSRIAPFYQLGSRLALTELLQNQLQQSGGSYRLLLIEFQQFDQLEAVLGRQKTTELLQLYLNELQLLCQQQGPAVVSLGAASHQTLYALSSARLALLLQSVDFVSVFSKIRALLQQRFSLDTLAPDFMPRFASISVDPALANDAEDLLAHALLTLTCVDHADGYLSYQPQLAAQSIQKLAMVTDLSKAATRGELSLAFQPLQDLTSQRIIALEALLRWEHPLHGQISPAVFIPLAEETGLIHNLTRWVYRQVRQTQDLLLQRGQKLQIAINLSGYDLENYRLISSILKHEQQYPTAQKVKFELTESALQRDSVAARQSLALLQKAGAVLVMDDFGAGQSMLAKLMVLQIYEIKIDMAMLRMLGTQREIVLAAIIRLAKSMAKRVICEGVESQPQYDFLTLHNVDAVQGYFIARPMPLPQLLQWLNSSAESAPVLSPQV
jgi:EAL domain-containing protein (putative c-di-GMP-specific phosphodiesterase class I)